MGEDDGAVVVVGEGDGAVVVVGEGDGAVVVVGEGDGGPETILSIAAHPLTVQANQSSASREREM
jgi:hypothetical protein